MSYLAGEIMDGAAALLNDTALSIYNYPAQIPYLNIALVDFRERLQLANAPISNETSAVITIPLGTTFIDFSTTPPLPTGLMEIQQIWYRQSGTDDSFLPMNRREFLPHYLDQQQFTLVNVWAWLEPTLRFIAATSDTDIKIDYIKDLFPTIVQSTDEIEVLNGKSYLIYKTAALLAKYVGENASRSDELNVLAQSGLDNALGIATKGRQAIVTRRQPFRAAFRSRSGYQR